MEQGKQGFLILIEIFFSIENYMTKNYMKINDTKINDMKNQEN